VSQESPTRQELIEQATERVELKSLVVGLGNLLLDPNNYRLGRPPVPDEEAAAHQDDVLRTMVRQHAVDELVALITDHGWLDYDRIVIRRLQDPIRSSEARPLFVVVEGNRRTSALKLLHSSPDRESLKPSVLRAFKSLNVVLLEGAPADVAVVADTIMGLRHIKMVRPWGARQRDRFVALLYESSGLSFQEVGTRISEGRNKTKARYRGWRIYEQARDELTLGKLEPSVEGRLYHLLTLTAKSRELRNWLGWKDSPIPTETAVGIGVSSRRMVGVPESGLETFGCFVALITDGQIRNPDMLATTARIVASAEARAKLEETWNFEQASAVLDAETAFGDRLETERLLRTTTSAVRKLKEGDPVPSLLPLVDELSTAVRALLKEWGND
jgi:hypothetical protein